MVGVEFNLNALQHLNESVGTDFDLDKFAHEAVYDRSHQRIEMRLVSLTRHSVDLADETIRFEAGEHIVTEYSHKYSIDSFADLAGRAGWQHESVWTDEKQLFSVHFLTAPE